MRKTIFLTLLISVLMITITGCNKNNNPEKYKKMALSYLNENYDDEFIAKSYSGPSWAYNYATLYFASSKYNDTFEVRIEKKKDDYDIIDNYYHIYMMKDAEEYFNGLVDDVNITSKIRFQNYIFSDELDNAKTFIDYINTGKCDIDVVFISNKQFSEVQMNELMNKIAANKIKGLFWFMQINKDKLITEYSVDEILNHPSGLIISEYEYSISDAFEVKKTD